MIGRDTMSTEMDSRRRLGARSDHDGQRQPEQRRHRAGNGFLLNGPELVATPSRGKDGRCRAQRLLAIENLAGLAGIVSTKGMDRLLEFGRLDDLLQQRTPC